MLKAMIVEDEYLAREELTYLIKQHSDISIIATFDNGLDAFKFLQSNSVDVVFLDIQIPTIDGVMLARNIHQFSEKPAVIFTTAYKDFAAEAFELEAFDYLLKPLNEQRVISVLNKLKNTQSSYTPTQRDNSVSKAKTINLCHGNRIRVTHVDEIYYAEASEKVTKVYTKDSELIAPYSISEFIARLQNERFFRSHRSYCVNLDHIKEITPWVNSTYILSMHDISGRIPVSRGNLKHFKEIMQL